MFKFTTLVIFCLSVLSVFQPLSSKAEIAESNRNNSNVTRQPDDSIQAPPTVQRSPEALERERYKAVNRQLDAREKQLEWRRKYGDLSPSRQSPPFSDR